MSIFQKEIIHQKKDVINNVRFYIIVAKNEQKIGECIKANSDCINNSETKINPGLPIDGNPG